MGLIGNGCEYRKAHRYISRIIKCKHSKFVWAVFHGSITYTFNKWLRLLLQPFHHHCSLFQLRWSSFISSMAASLILGINRHIAWCWLGMIYAMHNCQITASLQTLSPGIYGIHYNRPMYNTNNLGTEFCCVCKKITKTCKAIIEATMKY